MSDPQTVGEAGIPLGREGEAAGEAVARFLGTLDRAPALVGFGEPTHGTEAFPLMRNRVVEHLVRHRGFRSVAIESDCLAGPLVDAYVSDGVGDLDEVLDKGFSHEFGTLPSNRALVEWLREFNAGRAPEDRVRFYGIDGPMEMMSAPSPRAALMHAHRYLAEHLGDGRVPHDTGTLDALLGDDAAWANEAAMMDPGRSLGNTDEVGRLRLVADDVLALMDAEGPGLREATSDAEYDRAHTSARTALGLLRYHAAMASPGPMAERLAALLSLREVAMGANLAAVASAEAERGPCLVFAHNAHLWRRQGVIDMGGSEVRWWSAGSMVAPALRGRYVVVASDMAEGEGTDAADGDPGSLQGVLSKAVAAGGPERPDGAGGAEDAGARSGSSASDGAATGALFPVGPLVEAVGEGRGLHARKDLEDPRYIPLDGTDGSDAIAFFRGWDSERVPLGGGSEDEGAAEGAAEASPRSDGPLRLRPGRC